MTEQKIVLSGMRSTGKIHLGNYFGALKNWVDLQDRYRCYYFAADWHALTSDYADPSQIAQNTIEMVIDWIAAGLDPERSTIFIQSMVPDHAELHLLLSMLTPLGWLERVPTYKEQIQQIENKDLSTYGFLGYPVLQTVDIAIYRAHFVPVGEDQASHLEISREIVRRFNYLYKAEVFPEPQALFTPTPKVPGIDGRKMSKSYGNAINLSDSPEVILQKCKQMFTDPQRLKRSDPGRPEVCNLYEFHKLLSPPEVQERVAHECRAAQIGCVDDKKLLAQILIDYLEPIRRRREELVRDRDTVYDILVEGSRKARERTAETMERCAPSWASTTTRPCGRSADERRDRDPELSRRRWRSDGDAGVRDAGPQPRRRRKGAAAAEEAAAEASGDGEEEPASLLPEAWQVHLPIFDGPLDLLLHLIKLNRVEITDIPVATICDQFHAYLQLMEELNLDVAGEYIYEAAVLIHIKSKMLLPRPPRAEGEPEEDPRQELVDRLLEYRRLKEVAQSFAEVDRLRMGIWTRQPQPLPTLPEDEEQTIDLGEVSLFDLLGALQDGAGPLRPRASAAAPALAGGVLGARAVRPPDGHPRRRPPLRPDRRPARSSPAGRRRSPPSWPCWSWRGSTWFASTRPRAATSCSTAPRASWGMSTGRRSAS